MSRRRAWLVVLAFAAGAPLMVAGMLLSILHMRNDVTQWLPVTYPETQSFIQFLRHFDPEAFVLVSWEGCTLDDPRIGQLAEAVVGPPSMEPGASRSPYFSKVITGPSLLEVLTSEPINLTREEALERLSGSLIGPDHQSTCVVFTMTPRGVQEMRRAVTALQATAQSSCGLSPNDLKLGGPPVDNVALDLAGEQSMLRVFGLTTVCGLAVAWWCLRQPRLIAIVISSGLYTVAASLTAFHFTGGVMDAIVLTMPALVWVTAVSGAIHLANYYRELVPVVGLEAAPSMAMRQAALPLYLATFTTAVGLLSLAASELTPIRMLGIYSAVGVFIGFGCTIWLVPSALRLWPVVPRENATATVDEAVNSGWAILPQTATRFPGLATLATLSLLGLCAWGLLRLETSVQIMRLFSPDAKILRDYGWLESRLGPLAPVEVVVSFTPNSKLDFRQRVVLVQQIQQKVNELNHVGSSLSAATFAPDFSKVRRTRLPFGRTLTTETEKVRLKRHRDDFLRTGFLRESEQGELWRITARVEALADVDFSKFGHELDKAVFPIVQRTGDEGIHLTTTGVLPIVYQAQNSLLGGMLLGYSTDLLLLGVAMLAVVRSLSAGLLLLLPSVVPAIAVFGIMGWTGIVADMGSVMPPAVALGVTVDDVMHFLLRYRDGLRAGQSRRNSVMEAYRHCGRAMYQSWAILGLGTLVFALSPFVPTQRFGFVMAALLTIGLVGNLFFLPALLCGPLGALWEHTIRRRNQKDATLADQSQAVASTDPGNTSHSVVPVSR
jgi:predicted RND superfamily exporter protein